MNRHQHVWHRTMMALALALLVLVPPRSAAALTLCFRETGQCIADPLGAYWQANGALPVFGFPATTLAPEMNGDAAPYLTQWFERHRLEIHPEHAAPYDVLLGRLGAERLQQLGVDWTTLPHANPTTPHYFAVTGHAIAPQFWEYWRTHGLNLGDAGISERESLALFGYPLTEPRVETNAAGDTVLTQWFERARFEYHPTNPDPYTVLLGLLGNEVRATTGVVDTPAYEHRRGSPIAFLISYYNAINREEYRRAYQYWESPGSGLPSQPADYSSFVQGYADTVSVAVTFGSPASSGAAGSIYASVPTVIMATHTDGTVHTFAGCYIVRHTNPGIDPSPTAELWRIYNAMIAPATAGATAAELLPQQRCLA